MKAETCEIGARATIFIALNSSDDSGVDLETISNELNAPFPRMAEILKHLEQAEILSAIDHGYQLNPDHPSTLVLSVLIEAIDKDESHSGCGHGLHPCSNPVPCALHDQFVAIRAEIESLITSTSISGL